MLFKQYYVTMCVLFIAVSSSGRNSYPVRVMNNLQGEGKGDSVVECRV